MTVTVESLIFTSSFKEMSLSLCSNATCISSDSAKFKKKTITKLWMLAWSHAETELENAIKVGGEVREFSLIPARIDSTSFKHVAAYKKGERRE